MSCALHMADVSYLGYEYFAEFMRERDMEIGRLRKEVAESNKVSYSEAIFNGFIGQSDCKLTVEAYDAFFQDS